MDRSFSSQRVLITTLVAAVAAATVQGCSNPELPPGLNDTVRTAEKAPPPISGGTLLVTSKGIAVATDPDRDVVYMVDLNNPTVKTIALEADDEPGRVIEDSAGRVHVALRRGGDVVTIDPSAAKVLARSPVCPAPRGMAHDPNGDVLHVACAGGELVTLPAAGGAPVRTLRFQDRDLRDVAVSGDSLLVTRFRKAEVLKLDNQGNIVNRQQPPIFDSDVAVDEGFGGSGTFSATGAFRMVPLAGGGVALSHQRSLTTPVVISQPDGYGGRKDGTGCNGGIVHPTVTEFDANGNPKAIAASPILPQATLPVDMAVSKDGNSIAVVAAGSDKVFVTSLSDVNANTFQVPGGCMPNPDFKEVANPIAAAFWGDTLIVQTREPVALHIYTSSGDLPVILNKDLKFQDTGHSLFHKAASDTSQIACASCHLDGHDDGHVWEFESLGKRRTQTLSGDVFQTLPLHWDGDMKDLGMIMDVVFQSRMGGEHQGPRHLTAVETWISSIPRLAVSPPTAPEASIQHGAQLFVSTGCATCHSGALYTNNTNQDVGTGFLGQSQAFQVPSLIGLANRAPYLHDGSAATLKDRFTMPGASTRHGNTLNLTTQDIDDLVAYLETL